MAKYKPKSKVTSKRKKIQKKITKFAGKKILLWLLTASLPVTLIVVWLVVSVPFVFFYMVSSKVDSALAKGKEGAISILEVYTEELENKGKDVRPEDIEYDLEESSGGSNSGGGYENTTDIAEQIEGTSLLHQVHNAIVDALTKYNTDLQGYSYAYIIGTSLTETSGMSGVKWSPWLPIPPEALSSGNVDLKNWSYKDTMQWKAKTGFSLSTTMAGDSYIGPFQTDYRSWNGKMGMPQTGWSDSQWGQFVSGSLVKNDGNGDGVADVFNYFDALKNNSNYYADKYTALKNYQLKSDEGKEEMLTMMVASRYVGVQGRDSSKNISGNNFEWDAWDYQYIEGVNPHIDLMRSAYNEWKNNGEFYKRYKSFMEGQTTSSSNGPQSKEIIRDFYIANGWTQVGKGFKKNYPDGSGHIIIRGPGSGSDQDVYYPFRVFWGGKIAEDNIKKLLTQSNG